MGLPFYSFTDPITITSASAVPFLSSNRSDLANTVTFTHTAAGIISLSGALLANRFDATTLNLGTIDATTINLGTASTTQSINIGTGSGVTTINLGGAGDTVNIAGTLTWVNTTTLDVTDKLIRVNKGGLASSGNGAGLEVEENGSVTGYIQTTSDRIGWNVKSPARSGSIKLSPGTSAFTGEIYTPVTANRTWTYLMPLEP